MTQSPDYRLFLNSEFIRVHEKLDYIKEQTTKTNNRLANVEERVSDTEEAVIKHPINCPQVAKIENIQNDLEVYRIIKRYPKLALFLIAIFVVGIIISAIGTFETIAGNSERKELKRKIDNVTYRLAPYRSVQDTTNNPK